jgi:outer membrane protein OmpA-like peptidoglycan-associated protein
MQTVNQIGCRVASIVSTALFLILLIPPAQSETLRRLASPDPNYDCRREAPGGGTFDWRATVALEHCARIVRMARIAEALSYGAQPEFFDGFIEPWRLPANVGVRLPLLRVVFPERVFFDTDQVTLRPEAYDVIDVIARNLEMELPDVALFVAGHADSRGSQAYNLDLSSRRANAIAEAIAQRRGMRGGSVWRVGFGEDMPLYAGASDLALGYNRRIEFYFASRVEALQVYIEEDLPFEICLGPDRRSVDACRNEIVFPQTGYSVREVLPQPPGDRVTAAPGAGAGGVAPPTQAPGGVSPRAGGASGVAPAAGAAPVVVQRTPREISVIPTVPRS